MDRYLTGTTKQPLVQYVYDAFGRRASRTAYSGGAITEISSYGYYQDMLLEEKHLSYSGNAYTNNSVSKKYVYGPGGSDDVAVISQNYGKKVGASTYFTKTNYYLQKDHLGSPEKVTNDSGVVIEEYSYTPFGGTYIKNSATSNKFIPLKLYTDALLKTIPNGSTGTLYRNTRLFTGREYDTETGLYYQRARHYDPASGRFLQKDPIGTKDDVNLYRYVKNSPLNFTDPTGLFLDTIWDIGNIAYDAGRGVKNIAELAWNGTQYAYGSVTNNSCLTKKAVVSARENFSDLGEVAIDVGTDAAAAMIPFVPAGTTKVVRAGKKIKNGIQKPDLNTINNEKLKRIIGQNYREGAIIGNGSTADAIRYTKKTGELVGGSNHLQKGQDTINALERLLKSGTLDNNERNIATNILNDLKNALN